MVMNWWKETSASQEQLWRAVVGWLLCDSHRFTDYWASQEMGNEEERQERQAWMSEQEKSHLH